MAIDRDQRNRRLLKGELQIGHGELNAFDDTRFFHNRIFAGIHKTIERIGWKFSVNGRQTINRMRRDTPAIPSQRGIADMG